MAIFAILFYVAMLGNNFRMIGIDNAFTRGVAQQKRTVTGFFLDGFPLIVAPFLYLMAIPHTRQPADATECRCARMGRGATDKLNVTLHR